MMSNNERKIGTLFDKSDDERQGNESDNSGSSGADDGDSDKRARLYVGGSSKSGQQVLGPPRKNSRDVFVQHFFAEASKHGGKFVALNNGKRQEAAFKPFSGPGRSLAVTPQQTSATAGSNRIRPVRLQMWSDCFTVDNGPPRPYNEPMNQSFLTRVMMGRVPPELLGENGEDEVVMQIENNSKEPRPKNKEDTTAHPFAGKGYLLGSPTPKIIGAGKVGEKFKPDEEKPMQLPDSCNVDDSKPMTNVQVRFPNGGRLVLRVNLHHTVRDLRLMVCSRQPGMETQSFGFVFGFPPVKLSDETLTVEQAGLKNSSLLVYVEGQQSV